jgi:hypothetical protein
MASKAIRSSILLWGWTFCLFLLISYLLCIILGLLAPQTMHMHEAWSPLLPGYEWLTLTGFFAGAIDRFAYGWYIAIIIVPIKACVGGKLGEQ